MFQQALSKTETDIRLPFLFILFALLSFLTSQGFLVFQADAIMDGLFRTPFIWAAAHLYVLGWATMVAMGAMYQLIPVAFLVPIWSIRLGYIQFAITAIGIITIALSFSINVSWLVISGGFTVIGMLLFLFQMVMTLKNQKEKNILSFFVITALICLFLTMLLGLLLAVNLGSSLTFLNHLVLLKTHILLGLAGWFTLLIMGFSYKLVPMFSLAHGFSMKLSYWVFGVYSFGLIISTISFILANHSLLVLGLTLLFTGFSLFALHTGQILKKRMKKRLDKAFFFSLVSIAGGLLIHLFAVIFSLLPNQSTAFSWLIYFYVIVWITFTISGYLFKIVPFLWWTYKYSDKAGKKATPLLKDLISDRAATVIFSMFLFSVFGIALATLLQAGLFLLLSQTLFFAATACFFLMVVKVMTK